MRRYCASVLTGSTVATASLPATARRFLPCTPSPTTITRLGDAPSLVADVLLDRVYLFHYLVRQDRPIAVVLALHAGSDAAEDGSDHVVLGRHHRKRRVSEERVAGTDRIDHSAGEAFNGEKRPVVDRRVGTVGNDPAIAQLENQRLAARALVELQRERPHDRILVPECEPGFALVRRDVMEILEVADLPPPAPHLPFPPPAHSIANPPPCRRDPLAVKNAVAKVAEHHR